MCACVCMCVCVCVCVCCVCVCAGESGHKTFPNAGFVLIFDGALMKLVSVVQAEYHTKPVHVNEV